MKIKSLEIDGVGGIGHLEVSFGYQKIKTVQS